MEGTRASEIDTRIDRALEGLKETAAMRAARRGTATCLQPFLTSFLPLLQTQFTHSTATGMCTKGVSPYLVNPPRCSSRFEGKEFSRLVLRVTTGRLSLQGLSQSPPASRLLIPPRTTPSYPLGSARLSKELSQNPTSSLILVSRVPSLLHNRPERRGRTAELGPLANGPAFAMDA